VNKPARVKISALGTYVPPRLLTNADLEKMVDTSNEWILERTGIRERHIVDKGVATSDLATEAAKKALTERGLLPTDVETIVVATVSPDMFFPSTACLVQHKLGAAGAWGFDLSAACSAFLYALQTGAQFVANGLHKKVLVIGADVMSSIIDYTDRATCVIFGDGAGAVILEPIMMNVGICMPRPGFLEGLREICTRNGALLIFDEVKTGAKLGWGGASEYFGVKPDMITLAKSIGGGVPLAAFGASREVMDLIVQHKVFHGGTYNTNRFAMAAGLATFREVLTRENYLHVGKLSRKLTEGYSAIIKKAGIQGYVASAGVNGALMLYPEEIRNYRDWLKIDVDLWRQFWFGMVNRGVLAMPYWWDEQWTISVQHTEADIEKHLAVFEEIAPGLAKAQAERGVAFVGAAGH